VGALREKYGDGIQFDKRYGKTRRKEVDLSSPFGLIQFYMNLLSGTAKPASQKDAIAVVYVEGPIVQGSSSPGGFPFGGEGIAYSTPIRRALDEVAEDKRVKGVVLRVNSPGGSAVASEIILNATKRVKQQKPLVVSMGSVAGSGGYYVACGADTIFADESTITGSIGVVAGKLATSGMWNKLGVQWKSTRRGENAGLLSPSQVFTDGERERMQSWMDEIYGVFKDHVTAIRGDRIKKEIEELAGGRVYTGRQALELGLVDRLGGLHDAIQFVAQQAEIDSYEIRVVPRPKDFVELLMQDLTGSDEDSKSLSLPESLSSGAAQPSLLKAILPLLKELDPQRAAAATKALQQLSIIHHDQLMLTMPIIDVRH
jgi:protease-4